MIGPSEDKDKRTRTVSSLSADLVEGTMDDYSLYSEEDEVNFVILPTVYEDSNILIYVSTNGHIYPSASISYNLYLRLGVNLKF